MKLPEVITQEQALNYEVAGSWLAGFVSIGWMRNLLSRYYANKVAKKHKRYLKFRQIYNDLL